MSFDDLLGQSNPSASGGPPVIVDIELGVNLLGSLVSENEEIQTDDSELLARLEGADTMATGVEARLDELLDTLDDLLTKLEQEDTSKSQEVVHPESQSGQSPSEQS